MTNAETMRVAAVAQHRRRQRSRILETVFWYAVLIGVGIITVLPFLWILSTSFKGPNDAIVSIPPQFIPTDFTFNNYIRVWNQLPIARFFVNSVFVAATTTALNILITAMAAYPLAKMNFRGREPIFYLLLATFIIPAQLTYIPSFVMAVNFFHYYDTLLPLIFPSLATVFNIFLLRQAFQAVPNDLLDAARMDGAGELRIWWQILLPIIRPTLATVAIFTFVVSWNDFFWPSLMLHTRENMTLPVGLIALQGMFASDFRGVAAGVVMTVVPILIFFIVLQRQFVKGLTGAVKG